MAQPPQANFNNLIAGLGQLTAAIQAQVAAAVPAVPGGPIVPAVRETSFVRIDPFYGDSQDPISWLEDFENAATANRLTDNQKLQVVPAYQREQRQPGSQNDKQIQRQHHNTGDTKLDGTRLRSL